LTALAILGEANTAVPGIRPSFLAEAHVAAIGFCGPDCPLGSPRTPLPPELFQAWCGCASSADKVKSLSPHHRFVIALRSPSEVAETGLRVGPSERKARKLACGIESDTFSGPVCEQQLRNCGDFLRFSGQGSRISLQSRLCGGGRGIRTPGTLSGTSVFKTDCFNRSHIPPH
jgi:hypothetical protein